MIKSSSEYILKHKNRALCLMNISENGDISKIRKNESESAHFPLGGQMNEMKFHEWWQSRAIPKTRHGAIPALQKLGYSSVENALVNNLGLSLNDCYWICPRNKDITWEEVNLFSNNFSDAFGELTINEASHIDMKNRTRFDCATSQGELQKKWCIDADGNRFLIKGNYGNSFQQSLNEVFAANIHKQQNWNNFAEYFLVELQTSDNVSGIGCGCYNFCNENTEYISAWELLQTRKTIQNESLYFPLKEICLDLGMQEQYFSDFMDYQILTDYLISNTDRHMNNIGILRNPDTLELIGFAPIFDSGNSMFYNIPLQQLGNIKPDEIKTHSFIEKETRLLKYVNNKNIFDLAKLNPDFSVYDMDIVENQQRIPLLRELFEKKMERIELFQRGREISPDKWHRTKNNGIISQ